MKSSKSSLFLIELIIAILFFAMASAVCIQLFVKSHLLGQTTTDENHALLVCQNLSEIYLGSLTKEEVSDSETLKNQILALTGEDPAFAGIRDISAKRLAFSPKEGEFSLLVCYDADWHPCFTEKICYQVVFIYEGYDADADVYRASAYAYRIKQPDSSMADTSGTVSSEESASSMEYEEIYHLNICKHIPERMQ